MLPTLNINPSHTVTLLLANYAFNYIFARQLWLLVPVPVLLRHSSIQLTAIDLVIVEALLLACCDRCCVYCASFFWAKKYNSRRFTLTTWLQSFILHLELSLIWPMAQIKKQAVIHYMVTTLADPVSRVPFPSESFRGILTMLDCTERHILE